VCLVFTNLNNSEGSRFDDVNTIGGGHHYDGYYFIIENGFIQLGIHIKLTYLYIILN
jgi:hypothetical protein